MQRRLVSLIAHALSASAAVAQMPSVGIIDVYGLRTVSEAHVRAAAGITVGDSVAPGWRQAARAAVSAIPAVTATEISTICCEEGRTIVYIGIAESGSASARLDPAPSGAVRLPAEMIDAEKALAAAQRDAVRRGDAGEDDSQGHSLVHDSTGRAIQERFIAFAARDLDRLRDVLRNSADSHHRAVAAQVIAYAADKRAIVPDLVYAMRDPSDAVRNDATRALALIAALAQRRPELGIHVPSDPFIEMLSSIVWTDRNKSSWVLMQLTQTRDSALLARLRTEALPSLVEMARWKAPGHAMAAVVMLGRIAGLGDGEIFAAFQRRDVEPVIAAARRTR